MMRYVANGLLGVGYLLGFVLVWLGLELLIFDREQVSQGLVTVAAGIAWWSVQVYLGKRLAVRRQRKTLEFKTQSLKFKAEIGAAGEVKAER